MHNYIYIMYNKLSGRYESAMSFPSDAMAIHRLEKNVDTEEYELCRVGKFNIENGVVEAESPVRIILPNNTREENKE